MNKIPISSKSIGRLSFYRRNLYELSEKGIQNVYSHQLADAAGVSAAQVRRDLMVIGYTGSTRKGYEVEKLVESIGSLLDAPESQNVALVGVGNLGNAVIAYFSGRRPNLRIVAAFDKEPSKTNRIIHECRCYPVDMLMEVIKKQDIRAAIICVPQEGAQKIADALVHAGVKAIMNFAPTSLRVPPGVYIENVDISTSLEKVAYFAR